MILGSCATVLRSNQDFAHIFILQLIWIEEIDHRVFDNYDVRKDHFHKV